MGMVNINSILFNAERFHKLAQTFEYKQDPMFKALAQALGKTFVSTVWSQIEAGRASSIQVDIKYAPPGAASFELFITGGSEPKEVEAELVPLLNSKFGPVAGRTIARFQKEPMSFKYTTFEKA